MDQHPGEPNKQARSRPEAPVPDTSTVYAAKTDSVYRLPSSPSGTPCVPALLSLKGYHSDLVEDEEPQEGGPRSVCSVISSVSF